MLSLVPAVYAHDFDKVKTTGSIAVKGRVKGEYGDNAFPSFGLEAKVDNAGFQYPDLPLPARDIAMDLSLTNPGGSADNTLVNLRKFHVMIGRNPIDATLMMRTPISDRDVDARCPASGSGRRAAHREDGGRRSARRHHRRQRGGAHQNVGRPAEAVRQGQRERQPGRRWPHRQGKGAPQASRDPAGVAYPGAAESRSQVVHRHVGSSDLQASGTIQNLLCFAMRDDTLRGVATVRSNKFNLDEWQSGDSDLQVIPVPPKIDFDLDATVAELTYDKLKMTNAHGRVRIKDQRVTLKTSG